MKKPVLPVRAGIPKGDKRQRTRTALLKAAAANIREKGYEGTSLEDVAARAGMSRGAIYGNFKNREDLFMAVAQDQWRPVIAEVEPGKNLKAHLRAMGEALAKAAKERRRGGVHAAAYRVYLLTHEDMRARAAAQELEAQKEVAKRLRGAFGDAALPMPAEHFARLLYVLGSGLVFAHFLAPDQITEEFIIASFEALAPQT